MIDSKISDLPELSTPNLTDDFLAIVDNNADETKKITPLNLINSVIDDQSGSNYFDIGGMRIQWGEYDILNAVGDTISLPVTFANTSYSLVGSVPDTSNRFAAFQSKTTTDFIGQRISVNPNASETGLINWIAIGLKPT